MTPPNPLPGDMAAPQNIERASMAIIDSEVPVPRPFEGAQWQVVRRLIHTSADFEMLSLAAFHPEAVEAGLMALGQGATIVADTRMAATGISAWRTDPLGCRTVCFMDDPEVAALAGQSGLTRARLSMDRAASLSGPLIFAIGNAPTALMRLLDHMEGQMVRPALVVGMPVGFVNAAESKDRLMAQTAVPFISIAGRKGGSALAAATVNALADILLSQRGLAVRTPG
jgi:precorrin-8X/cobalt-precorrin-8 methylmutase